MNPFDEIYINRYHYSENEYIETIRLRHDMYSDAWFCYNDGTKRYITSFNSKEKGWFDKIIHEIEEHLAKTA